MKGRSLLLSAILILVIGIVLILTYQTTRTTGIVTVGGTLFILVGVLNLLTYFGERGSVRRARAAVEHERGAVPAAQDTREGLQPMGTLTNTLAWITSIGAGVLGLCMLIFNPTFATLVPTVFAALIVLGALFQFYLLAYGCRPLRLPAWLFAVPVALLGVAVYVFMQKAGDDVDEQRIMLVTGITFVVFSATMFIEGSLIGLANRNAERRNAAAQQPSDKAEKPKIAPEDDKTV